MTSAILDASAGSQFAVLGGELTTILLLVGSL
jgi:hypothetical protein